MEEKSYFILLFRLFLVWHPHPLWKIWEKITNLEREKITFKWLFLICLARHPHALWKSPKKYIKNGGKKYFEWLFLLFFLASHPHPQLCCGKALAIKSKSKDYFHKETKEKSHRWKFETSTSQSTTVNKAGYPIYEGGRVKSYSEFALFVVDPAGRVELD